MRTMKTATNINRIYDIVEAKITELNGSRPNATETFLGLDSLDLLEIAFEVENKLGIKNVSDYSSYLNPDMTPLEITISLWQVAEQTKAKQ